MQQVPSSLLTLWGRLVNVCEEPRGVEQLATGETKRCGYPTGDTSSDVSEGKIMTPFLADLLAEEDD
jgi:hypothetical protein